MSAAGRAKFGPDRLRAAGIELDLCGCRAAYLGHEAALTRTEMRVLAALMRDPRAVLTREELIRLSWPPARPVSARAVDVNVTRIRQKLEAAAGKSPIRSVAGVGYGLAGNKSAKTADPHRLALHALIDDLSECDLAVARRYLKSLLESGADRQ